MFNIRIFSLIILTYLSCSVAAHTDSNGTEKQLLFVSGPHSNKAKVTLLKKAAKEQQNHWHIKHLSATALNKEHPNDEAKSAFFNGFNLIVLDAVSKREAKSTFAGLQSAIEAIDTPTVAINFEDNQALNKGVATDKRATLLSYWKNAGRRNLDNMLKFIDSGLINPNKDLLAQLDPPLIFPEKGIYHPKLPSLIANNLALYQQMRVPSVNQPKIAILMQRASIETEQTELVDKTIAMLEAQGAYVVPFYFKLSRTSGDYSELLQLPNDVGVEPIEMVTGVDLIINFRNIHWAEKRKVEFERFGVPVMQAMVYYSGNKKVWEEDKQGVSSGMMSFTLVLPESAGVVDPMIVAAMDMQSQQVETIDYQLKHMVNKAMNVVKLKYTANKDKKLAVFIWGDRDVGASFLNIFASLDSLSQRLAAEGYQTAERDEQYFVDNTSKILDPFYRDYQLQQLLEEDLAELMPIDEYLSWFNTLPNQVQQQINQQWGEPQDNFMAVNKDGKDYFVMPRIRNGNMLIMRQAPRSDNKNDENMIYHQGLVPMNHFYLASYYYARQYWQSDAIIHFGTHGSQEYLGGKERGLSMYDQGNLAVWDTPVVYPFIVDDVGEAMQTKRRGRATVISHMTPPFAAAGLHGDIAQLHELMHQHGQLDQGGVKQKTAKQIVEVCNSTNICKDLNWGQMQIDADFSGFMEALHRHLESLAVANQPLGLHSFGQLPEQHLVTSTIVQMLGIEFSQRAGQFEQRHYLYKLHKTGHSHSHVGIGEHTHDGDEDHHHGEDTHTHNYHEHQQSEQSVEQSLAQLAGFKTAYNYIVNANSDKAKQPVKFDDMPELLKADIEKGRKLYSAMMGNNELDAMVDFLSAKYVPVKTGGDPIRHNDSLPTGYNLYGFNPSKVPTKAAFEQGKELVEQMVADYYQNHGKYPDKMAFSLWSIETMRHYGVLEAQAMYAMGVKPKWGRGGRVVGTEIIPYSELKRPRIDVVLSATGLYRDAFPNVMQLLAKAVNQVAALKEENNFVYRHSQKVKAELIEQGVEAAEAEYLSTVRIFSNQSGDYSSGVDDAVWASDTWETDAKIADNYLGKMGFFFGADNKRWGEKAKTVDGKVVDLYAKQLSGTDIALFARSSNLYGMLSTDDPFEYFGALSLAVRNIDGKSPQMVVSNLRQANNPRAEDAALFLANELRTRVFHPRWIKAMKDEGRAGATSLASRMDNFFGWQVVDPNMIRDDQWDEYMDVYMSDSLDIDIDQWFKQVNPEAFARMMERMLEASRKEYWDITPERLKALVELYIDMVNQHDLIVLNDGLKDYVDQQAVGFGLAPLTVDQTIQTAAANVMAQKQQNNQQLAPQIAQTDTFNSAEQQVEGQVLEKQTAQSAEADNFIHYALLLMLLTVALGGLKQGFGWRFRG